MANPFHHHHHHHNSEEDEQPYPPTSTYPPSPFFNQPSPYPPYPNQPPLYPPQSHPYPPYPSADSQPYPPFPSVYPPPPQSAAVIHTSHSPSPVDFYPPQSAPSYPHHDSSLYPPQHTAVDEHHHHRPHVPGFIADRIHTHPAQSDGGSVADLANKPSVRVFTKVETNFVLAIRDRKVVLARADPKDPTQHWVKDEKHSTKVKDQDGYPSFSLVNKATGQALKHSVGSTQPVQLTAYKPDGLDESILWSLGKDLGGGYRQIRMINNVRLVVDAVDGDKKRGGVHDGTTIALWQPGKGDNQRWKIEPY